MDDKFEIGLEQRKATLGAEYVEKSLANADDFTAHSEADRMVGLWLG